MVSNTNITFSPPDITKEDILEVVETLESGWITTGIKTSEFEKGIASLSGTDKAVAFNSATAALELTLRIMGVGPGDEVITSAYTYTATAAVVTHVGAKLILVDTDKDSYEMDYDALERTINERTKVIIPVDIAGKMCDYTRIFEIVTSKKHLFHPSNKLQQVFNRIIVLADGAHSFGAWQTVKGASSQRVTSGMAADFTIFSFHAVKNITTAEGGAVVWKSRNGLSNEELYRQYSSLAMHGQSESAFSKSKKGKWEYDVLCTGYKCNMTDIQAALGLNQLKRYNIILERRKEIIQQYDKAFIPAGLDVLSHYSDTHASSGHLYMMRLPEYKETDRNRLAVELEQRGIATNVHYKPLPMLTAYKKMGFDISNFPNAYRRYECEITLPLYTRLTKEEVDYIITNVLDLI